MGFMKDLTSVFSDFQKWYNKLHGVYHKSGMSYKFKNRKNNTSEKAQEKYKKLCNWMKGEMKK